MGYGFVISQHALHRPSVRTQRLAVRVSRILVVELVVVVVVVV